MNTPNHAVNASLRYDFIVHPGWIIPVVPRGSVLTDHSLCVKDGRISAIVPTAEAKNLNAGEHIELPDQVLMPGLVNGHGHAAMTLFRGYADDYPLMEWLQGHIWPAETAFVSEEFVRDGSDLAMAELLLGGTTTFSDMYFYPDITAERVELAGLRAQLCFPVIDVATAWARDPEDYLTKGLALREQLLNHDRIEIGFGPHSNYTVAEDTLKFITTLANELDAPVQIHLHETLGEVQMSVENIGERPIDQLHRIGLLGPRGQCVHMTAISDDDIALLANSGSHVIHCPRSNMKLASGICPVQRLLDAGVNVALGTDGAASNNRLNMLSEMQMAALVGKLDGRESTAVSAISALEMATLGGAKALGYDQHIGSLEVGKAADMICVDLGQPATQPVHNVISQLVYATSGSEVTHSWVNGRALVRDRVLTTINMNSVNARTREWRERLSLFRSQQHPKENSPQ